LVGSDSLLGLLGLSLQDGFLLLSTLTLLEANQRRK